MKDVLVYVFLTLGECRCNAYLSNNKYFMKRYNVFANVIVLLIYRKR